MVEEDKTNANFIMARENKNVKRSTAYLSNLDGLRGLGVLLVILYHLGYRYTRHSWLCISVFFSLSGLLITSITLQAFEKTGTVNIVKFWSRRVGRLFPSLFLLLLMCAASRFCRSEDEAVLWYEGRDILWAIPFLTNYNLVYVKKDDYFLGGKPSITRHLWTLSIEEQYYLIWPLVLFLWTKYFPHGIKASSAENATTRARSHPETPGKLQAPEIDGPNDAETEGENSSEEEQEKVSLVSAPRQVQVGDATGLFKALCCAELFVILFSYFSSWLTISKMGMSAAYFSTWSRMGDIACGGLVYLLVRLNPAIYERFRQQPGLKPMSTRFRVTLEVFWASAICLVVLPGAIPLPLDDMLHLYFYYFRLPYSLALCVLAVAGSLQISEPLPRWAVFSRALSSKFFIIMGFVSYEVYLIHWPVICFFGNPVNHAISEKGAEDMETLDDEEESHSYLPAVVRDGLLLLVSVALGWISFFYFAKPILFAARTRRSWHVVASGLFGAMCTAKIIDVCYSGVTNPTTNDVDKLETAWIMGRDADEQRLQLDNYTKTSGKNHEHITTLGESVAGRLGELFKEVVRGCLTSTIENDAPGFASVDIMNLAQPESYTVNYFLPCNETLKDGIMCSEAYREMRTSVLRYIPLSRPDSVILHDSHWFSDPIFSGRRFLDAELRLEAMNNFARQAAEFGVKNIHYLTQSAGKHIERRIRQLKYEGELIQSFLKDRACENKNSTPRIAFTVVAWHRLTCPTFEKGKCPEIVHGFKNILPDGTHPSGLSGRWLAAQTLASILAEELLRRPEMSKHFPDWETAIENSVSRCLLDAYQPDGNPRLEKLVQTRWICPQDTGLFQP